eukprot:TRINITY_DN16840_c0_g1_i10.p1 TRINITY_DN16840_c0_g1~~TRINITY_DN16840_c0_g1_i10.p1  ORF type:complete len:220 (-),score=101.06 TRINITY_DN16840_c0_g1_i10:157-816(-)
MPPKSKKAAAEKKAKIIDDKTFGLKNKNRSTKVQSFVQSVNQNVRSGNPNERKMQQVNDEKRAAKEAKKAFEAELNTLFVDVSKVKTTKEEEDEEVDKNLGVNPEDYLWTADDFDVVEEDNSRLEDRLEAEREALKDRTDLTPVTNETFQAWKAKKRKEAADAEAARIQKAKKSGGLRGKDLWEHDKALFVDDDEADDEYYALEAVSYTHLTLPTKRIV